MTTHTTRHDLSPVTHSMAHIAGYLALAVLVAMAIVHLAYN